MQYFFFQLIIEDPWQGGAESILSLFFRPPFTASAKMQTALTKKFLQVSLQASLTSDKGLILAEFKDKLAKGKGPLKWFFLVLTVKNSVVFPQPWIFGSDHRLKTNSCENRTLL